MICYFNLHGNSIRESIQGTVFISSTFKDKHGLFSHSISMRDNIAIFTTRSLTRSNWCNQADVYLKPIQNKRVLT
jgi:hypothetical protein